MANTTRPVGDALRRARARSRLLPGEDEQAAYQRGYVAWGFEDDERYPPDPEREHSTAWRSAYQTGRIAAGADDRYHAERERGR